MITGMGRAALLCVVMLAGCGRRDFNDGMPDAPLVDAAVDARPCELPPDCTSGRAYVCNGTCYALCYVDKTRAAAAVSCTEWGGCLATLADANQNNCAASMLTSEDVWVGATQDNAATTTTGGWSWCDGSALSYTAWMNGMPDDAEGVETGQEQCAALTNAGNWIDRACNFQLDYVCARPL